MLRWFALLGLVLIAVPLKAQLPERDQRGLVVRDVNTPRTFGTFTNLSHWQRHQYEAKMQILVSCGLWPMPEKTPLNPHVFGTIAREGYSVEKVYLESFPGVYVTGNLYRPKGRQGPFPAILNPHGHWDNGRLVDTTNASVAARCIQFARMGFVAFAYDMAGYNDASQFSPKHPDGTLKDPSFYNNHANLFREPKHQLWNLSLMGVQLWNSIRALDFLQSLPDVNPQAIGCTGESGGGTQTFLLAAVDDRIKVSVPAVMVSHTMQGGCWCENAPGLRVDYSNLDFAAAAAPRKQLLIGATGDWTKTTLEVEAPAVAGIYQFHDRPENFQAVRFDFGHNYNQTSREAAYSWFAQCWQGKPTNYTVAEAASSKEPDVDLLVFPDGKLPPNALAEAEFAAAWIKARERTLAGLRPTDPVTFTNFARALNVVWRRTLQLDGSQNSVVPAGAFGRPGKGDRIEKTLLMPQLEGWLDAVVVVAHPDGRAAVAPGGKWHAAAARMVGLGHAVLAFDAFQTGPRRSQEVLSRPLFTNFFTTYNRTPLQERVQDVLTVCAYAKRAVQARRIILVGEGEAGLWVLLGGGLADSVIADANGLDTSNDDALLESTRFFPGARMLGGLDTPAAMQAPKPLVIHNTAGRFDTSWVTDAYKAVEKPDRLAIQKEGAESESLMRWISSFAKLPR